MDNHLFSYVVLLCCTVLGTLALGGEMAEIAQILRGNCLEETGADVTSIDMVNAGTELHTVTDGKLKCYIKCVMETAGMMSEGEIAIEAVVAVLPEELQKHAEKLRECGTQKGSDDCDTAFKTQVCWQKGCGKDYILI